MMHSFDGLADEISAVLRKSGDTGDRGDKRENARTFRCPSVTPPRKTMSPLERDGCRSAGSLGDENEALNQCFNVGVTPGARVTSDSKQARPIGGANNRNIQYCPRDGQTTELLANGLPSSWVDGLAQLRAMESPDCFTSEQWRKLAEDAAKFLKEWGVGAASLGWSTHDLFGVDPIVPTVRFDAMGLIPILHGSSVIALTQNTATLRRETGAAQTFRRIHKAPRISLWEIRRLTNG